ncbi:polyprenyl synthetase family protein [Apilactobacillus micheneri]|uniref:Polyprenyl synthetase family protein n=1 Tax=Apilactobacillus micheneri TaxID=1899430 RepID=A0ABY2Z3D3_9LACO|nr:polyprenyl synthetase family protein [Apilactobacillus micheneri]TPR26202.1 polyprenyl synthetase family protein [Apilactobacillus micheneri]TPR26956.1 polyprenyl synthetase family protein [Apilactobacillus micheneri]TPR27814.1 polyprenyl synthetase family protein [Apilactobacillus micheneri]TPR31719.1 polyprenyl synthetase family protein [Apilactobacillus micheneri]TPR32123.1 polyprenyl synthetase family protein [Apilactobacillus micheneri]
MDLRLWKQRPELEQRLKTIENIMKQQVQINDDDFKKSINELINGSGKMLRAAFLMLFTEFGTQKDEDNYFEKVAASVELIHLASLVHDDVIDKSDLRRGVTSLNYNFGERTSIYLGDYLFVKYFHLVLDTLPSKEDIKYNVSGIEGIIDGELRQNETKFDPKRNEEQYLAAVQGKTADLFKIAAGNGAIISKADDNIIKLSEQIGSEFGIAFQLRDDLIDFEDTEEEAGKPILNDILDGVYTLPVIYAMQTSYHDELLAILNKKDQLKRADLIKVKAIVKESGSLDKTHAKMDAYHQSIEKMIDQLPNNSARKVLLKLVNKLFN